ncbi:MAG: cytochrome P450 [Haloarculaceae archaeon]
MTAAAPEADSERVGSAVDPPGPAGLEHLRLAAELLTGDVATVLLDVRERYGRVAALRTPDGGRGYLLADPAAIQHVLESNQGNYRKAAVYREELAAVFGGGLLTAEGSHWQRQHRMIRPEFRPAAVRSFADLVVEEAESAVERWLAAGDAGEPIDLLAEMERLTLLVIGKAMFSADMADHAGEIADALALLRRQFQRSVSVVPTAPLWVPTPRNRRTREAIGTLDAVVRELIDDRRGRADEHDDFLSRLLTARDEETGERMGDAQVRDELITFLLAGHETTAAALTWTWYLLARHPDVHERLHETVAAAEDPLAVAALGGPGGAETSFAKRCVQEAMRIYRPVPVFVREAIADDVVGDYRIGAGSDVFLSQFVVHRDPDLWADPLAYRPARFEPDAAAERPRYSYFPFGGGARMCIGREFALMEAQLVLAVALGSVRFRLRSPVEDSPGVSSAVTMVPDRPVEMAVEPW